MKSASTPKKKSNGTPALIAWDVHSREDFEMFREWVKADKPKSKQEALDSLVKAGIYTKSGRLTKNYR